MFHKFSLSPPKVPYYLMICHESTTPPSQKMTGLPKKKGATILTCVSMLKLTLLIREWIGYNCKLRGLSITSLQSRLQAPSGELWCSEPEQCLYFASILSIDLQHEMQGFAVRRLPEQNHTARHQLQNHKYQVQGSKQFLFQSGLSRLSLLLCVFCSVMHGAIVDVQ